jgi:hypothetical protein
MRSLWRILALEWLGGSGSEALTEASTIAESLPSGLSGEHARVVSVFDVRRQPGVSHRALMSPDCGHSSRVEIGSEEPLLGGWPGDYPR